MMDDFESSTENLVPAEIAEAAEKAKLELLPKKFAKFQDQQYDKFSEWCNRKKAKRYTEDVLLAYFLEKSRDVKASTLWAQYSMLKTTIVVRKIIDTYRQVL
jgi:hypothetical protein